MDYPAMPQQSADDIRRKAEMAKIHNTPVSINGKTVPIKHLFADEHSAKDFHSKVQLLGAGSGSMDKNGDADTDEGKMESTKETGDTNDGEDDMEPLDDKLFKGKGASKKDGAKEPKEVD